MESEYQYINIDMIISIITFNVNSNNISANLLFSSSSPKRQKKHPAKPGVKCALFLNDPLCGFSQFLEEKAIQPGEMIARAIDQHISIDISGEIDLALHQAESIQNVLRCGGGDCIR